MSYGTVTAYVFLVVAAVIENGQFTVGIAMSLLMLMPMVIALVAVTAHVERQRRMREESQVSSGS